MNKKAKHIKSEEDELLDQYLKEQKQRIEIVKKVLSKLKTIPDSRDKK